MDPLRQPQAQKMICETRPTSQINGKAEYPWREGNALYSPMENATEHN